MPTGYVHVLVDDASSLCQLTWHDGCAASDMVDAVQQWFAIFGIVPNWVSDQGSHFKNQVVEKLRRCYGSAHHFTPAYCPWANGTVEVLMRSIRKTLGTMLVELKLAATEVPTLLPMVQHALNHTPCSKCNGRAPITVHTQLPAGNALCAYHTSGSVEEATPAQLEQWRRSIWKDLAAARDQMHREVTSAANTKRVKERDRRNAHPRVRSIHLDIGDYVLVGAVSRRRSKLQIRWLGPRRVVQALTDWLFVVEDLRDGSLSEHHISRLKYFSACDLQVTQALLDHVAYVEGGHIVEELRDCKFDKTISAWVILVKWRGLPELENSWEPLANLQADVPVMVRNFVRDRTSKSKNVQTMARQCSLMPNDI